MIDLELERAYIANQLVSGVYAGPDRLSPLDCSSNEHARLLEVMYDMDGRGLEVDLLTVDAELVAQKAPRKLHGALLAASEGAVRLEPIQHLAASLRRLARARRVRGQVAQALIEVERLQTDDALERLREVLGEERSAEREPPMQAADTCRLAMAGLCESATTRPRLRSGFPRLDAAIRGFPAGTMCVVGGDTGSGKSSVLLSMAMHLAEHQGARVGIVSIEDAPAVWGERVLAHVSNLAPDTFGAGIVSKEVETEAKRGIAEAERLGVYFRFALSRPLPDVVDAMRDLVVSRGCAVLMVDYAQAIDLGGDDRRVAMITALRRLKGAAQELGVPLLLASQLARGDSDYREPTKKQLKEAGELENMAEIILLLWNTSDAEGAPVLGKVAKVKWSPKRPRFAVERNPRGAVCALVEPPAPEAEKPAGEGFRKRAANGNGRPHYGDD